MARTAYPDRARALRHVHRVREEYLYGRFPQRYILGMPPSDYYDGTRTLPALPGASAYPWPHAQA
ncbi:hypothetical protein ACFUJU_28810 [Streptomyces sp. NPDC057235]|uniref:hypothetical protein n=1 Tax=Streptomyces sp. NPDC057235 TaxID=3346058 RepID=UPI00363B62B5